MSVSPRPFCCLWRHRPTTIASYSLTFHLGSASMALSSPGLSPSCPLAPSVSDVITLSHCCISPPAVFQKAPFSVLCFSSCTLPPSTLISSFPRTTTFMQMTPVFPYLRVQLRLKHYSPRKCHAADLFLDYCQPFNSQFLDDWILTHWTQKATWQDTQLLI